MIRHVLTTTDLSIKECERQARFEAHADEAVLVFLAKMRKMDCEATEQWEKQIDDDVEILFSKWEICEFAVNMDAYMGLVLECKSQQFGDVVLKMYPPFLSRRYIKESFIMATMKKYPLAKLLAVDEERNAMLLSRVIPGDYIVYEEDREDIAGMFKDMYENRIAAADVKNTPTEIKGVIEQTEDEYAVSSQYNYYPGMVKYLLDCAKDVYSKYFANEEKFLLHGDAYYKNALRSQNGVRVIDPVGYVDAFIFEYMPLLTYELVMHPKPEGYYSQYEKMIDFFSSFTDTSKFDAATFVFLVKQLVPSIYEADDGYERANRYMKSIQALFLDERNNFILNKQTL